MKSAFSVIENQLKFPAFKTAKEQRLSHLENLFVNLPTGLVIVNARGEVVECNHAAVWLLGEPVIGQRWIDIIDRVFNPQGDDGHEVSLKDGRKVRIETTPIKDEPGQIIVLTDLTQSRLHQASLSQQQRIYSLGKMAASLAHQVRTPLSTAMLYASHLQNKALAEDKRKKFAEKLNFQLTVLEGHVRDMLLYVRGSKSHVETVETSKVIDALHQIAEDLMSQTNALIYCGHSGPKAQFKGNRDALVGAVQNLINNSVQACQEAGITPKIAVDVVITAQSELRIKVKDNGPGMTDEILTKIRSPFFTTKPGGTGLGLAVVRTVVEQHSGDFAISSDPDEGVVVTITIPGCKS